MSKLPVLLLLILQTQFMFAQSVTSNFTQQWSLTQLSEDTDADVTARREDSIREGIGWSRLLPFYSQIAMPFLSYFSNDDNVNLSIGVISTLIALQSMSVATNLGRLKTVKDKELNIAIMIAATASSAAFAYYNFSTFGNAKKDDHAFMNYALYQLSMIPLEVSVFTIRYD